MVPTNRFAVMTDIEEATARPMGSGTFDAALGRQEECWLVATI